MVSCATVRALYLPGFGGELSDNFPGLSFEDDGAPEVEGSTHTTAVLLVTCREPSTGPISTTDRQDRWVLRAGSLRR